MEHMDHNGRIMFLCNASEGCDTVACESVRYDLRLFGVGTQCLARLRYGVVLIG